jgi:hypothetical protein
MDDWESLYYRFHDLFYSGKLDIEDYRAALRLIVYIRSGEDIHEQ